LFLLEDRAEPPPNAFDIRARTACDLYNFALWRGMATGLDGGIRLKEGVRKLPVGNLAITLDLSQFPFQLDEFTSFEPTDRYKLRGISIRNRSKGIGSALIGVKKRSPKSLSSQTVPVSMFLNINDNLEKLVNGTATASLQLFSAYEENVLEVKGRHPPIETDITTPLAYGLESSKVWDLGLGAFLGKEFLSIPNGLYLGQPYQPGRIPVVFVHGTFSNPAWWTEMFNTLYADAELRQKYQFWYFLYNSSAPIMISAADLRDDIRAKVAELDPEGKDPALREMVVVGHSQGGLLTKLTAVDTGDTLLKTVTGKTIDELRLPEEKKSDARRILMVEPVKEVKRVIFISTPHRGSILSKNWVRTLIQKVVTLPVKIVETTLSLNEYMSNDIKRLMGKGKVPTSIDGMSPENPILQRLAVIPLAPGVTGHSIIAVKGDGDLQEEDDGVVAYTSAHIDGVESELVVHSGHSCQDNPVTIEEVRRILLKHSETEVASSH
jgi:pimeloyl-ACP methyl ester carboxylesterase